MIPTAPTTLTECAAIVHCATTSALKGDVCQSILFVMVTTRPVGAPPATLVTPFQASLALWRESLTPSARPQPRVASVLSATLDTIITESEVPVSPLTLSARPPTLPTVSACPASLATTLSQALVLSPSKTPTAKTLTETGVLNVLRTSSLTTKESASKSVRSVRLPMRSTVPVLAAIVATCSLAQCAAWGLPKPKTISARRRRMASVSSAIRGTLWAHLETALPSTHSARPAMSSMEPV